MIRVVEYFGQSLKAALSKRINMVTFANLGSVRLASLKFVGLRVRKIRRIQCISCLSTTVSQLFEPQLQKIFIFCLPWGRPCGNHAKRCMNKKTIQCLPNPSQHVPIYLHRRVAPPFYFFHTKRDGNIPTEIPLTGASSERGMKKITIFDKYFALFRK